MKLYAQIALLVLKGFNKFMGYLESRNLIDQGKRIEREKQIIDHEKRVKDIADIKRLARANRMHRK